MTVFRGCKYLVLKGHSYVRTTDSTVVAKRLPQLPPHNSHKFTGAFPKSSLNNRKVLSCDGTNLEQIRFLDCSNFISKITLCTNHAEYQ